MRASTEGASVAAEVGVDDALDSLLEVIAGGVDEAASGACDGGVAEGVVVAGEEFSSCFTTGGVSMDLFLAAMGEAASACLMLVDAAANIETGLCAGELLDSWARCRGSMLHSTNTPTSRSKYPPKKNFIGEVTRPYRRDYGFR